MERKISINDLVSSANYLAYDLETPSLRVLFKEVEQKSYPDSPFLDERLQHATGVQTIADFAPLCHAIENKPASQLSRNYIFHTSFCCSTLLARCFESLPDFFVLKEPWILRRFADLKRWNKVSSDISPENWQKFSVVIDSLLDKSYGQEKVIIKPTNIVNNLVAELMDQPHQPKAVMIYSSLQEFLISNLKKTEETQKKISFTS